MAGGVATTDELAPERIYVIGGRESDLEVPYTQVYNPIDDSWNLGTSMPTPRYYFAIAVLNDQIYTIGGITGAFTALEQKNQNEQYTPIDYIPEFPSWEILVAGLSIVLILSVFFRQRIKKRGKKVKI